MDLKVTEIALLKKSVTSILTEDQSIKVYLFGSRVDDTNRKYSDVDILIDAVPELSILQLSALKESMEQSSTSFIYDFVQLKKLYNHYSDNINRNKILLFEVKVD